MDILVPLPKSERSGQFAVVMNNCLKTLVKALPTSKTKVTIVTHLFLELCIWNCAFSSITLTNNTLQFVFMLLIDVCSLLVVSNNITSLEYHLLPYGHVECFNFSYFATTTIQCEHQMHWDTHVILLTYGYNIQEHISIKPCPFRSVNFLSHLRLPEDVTKHVPFGADDDTVPHMHLNLKLITRAIDL